MRIALTGATGFVGRHTLGRLVRGGHEVRAWYRGDEKPEWNGAESEAVEWVRGDLDDADSADRLVEGCEGVVHTALSRSGDSFMTEPSDPVVYFQTNVLGSLRLIDAAERAGTGRFVFISSGAVHQNVAEDLPLDERHPLWPGSLYGASKASVETLVHAYGLSGRLEIATLRPPSIVGVDDPVEKSKWFDLVRAMMRQESVDVSGGSKVVLVDDLARAIELLLSTENAIAGQTFNCTSGFYSTHRIAEMIGELTASQSKLTGQPKTSAREMETNKIEKLGMRFGGEPEIRRLLESLVEFVSF